jgi:hypothetical protein
MQAYKASKYHFFHQECFLFSVYTSKFKYGSCKQWIDKDLMTSSPIPEIGLEDDNISKNEGQCSACQALSNCSTCLQRFALIFIEVLWRNVVPK